MTDPASNPYAGLIEEIQWLKRVTEDDDTNVYGRTIEALSRLTRDVEAATAALKAVEPYLDAIVCYVSTMGEHEPNRIAHDVRATLTRLSRPTELGAEPAFVASQSGPSVSTKGFNRGERGEGN